MSGVQDNSAALKVICRHYTDSKIAITADFLAATIGNSQGGRHQRISGKNSRIPHPLPGVASRLEVCASGIEVVYPGRHGQNRLPGKFQAFGGHAESLLLVSARP